MNLLIEEGEEVAHDYKDSPGQCLHHLSHANLEFLLQVQLCQLKQ